MAKFENKLEELNKIMMDAKLKNIEDIIKTNAMNGLREASFFIDVDDYVGDKSWFKPKTATVIGPSKILFDFLEEQGYAPKIKCGGKWNSYIVVSWA